MAALGTFPSITAQIGGKLRRLSIERQWRRAIESRELTRASPVLLELGPDESHNLPAGEVAILRSIFDELLGPEVTSPAVDEGELALDHVGTSSGAGPMARLTDVAPRRQTVPGLAQRDTSSLEGMRCRRPQLSGTGLPRLQADSADFAIPPGVGWLFASMLLPIKRYAEFTGRARRREFWSFQLLLLAITLLNPIFIAAGVEGFAVLTTLILLGLLIPALAVAVRRLQDRDMAGGWLAAFAVGLLIPGINVLVFIATVWIFALPGTAGSNRFGNDPKAT